MKSRIVAGLHDALELETNVREAAAVAVARLRELVQAEDPLRVLEALKFANSGCDPLDASRPLNLVEQLNQTFTYLVTLRAVEFLLQEHPEAAPFRLNLGTASGSDVESEDGSVAAEVFAAVTPGNNAKLPNDIAKVSRTAAIHRYVFFYCPGTFERRLQNGVSIIPVSIDRSLSPEQNDAI